MWVTWKSSYFRKKESGQKNRKQKDFGFESMKNRGVLLFPLYIVHLADSSLSTTPIAPNTNPMNKIHCIFKNRAKKKEKRCLETARMHRTHSTPTNGPADTSQPQKRRKIAENSKLVNFNKFRCIFSLKYRSKRASVQGLGDTRPRVWRHFHLHLGLEISLPMAAMIRTIDLVAKNSDEHVSAAPGGERREEWAGNAHADNGRNEVANRCTWDNWRYCVM
jgi:hypothetical protein